VPPARLALLCGVRGSTSAWCYRCAGGPAVDGMIDDEAAKKFIDAHPQLVAKWLAGTGAQSAA
jgi:hypothetical protein